MCADAAHRAVLGRAVELYARLGYTRAPAYDIRAEELFELTRPFDLVAQAYAFPLARSSPEVAW
jgi:hypothetical protein